jgi:hypothetical protein
MCICNPSIKTPLCPKCASAIIDKVNENETFEKVKDIIKKMNGLSDEGFDNRYINDPLFRKGFNVLRILFSEMQQKDLNQFGLGGK